MTFWSAWFNITQGNIARLQCLSFCPLQVSLGNTVNWTVMDLRNYHTWNFPAWTPTTIIFMSSLQLSKVMLYCFITMTTRRENGLSSWHWKLLKKDSDSHIIWAVGRTNWPLWRRCRMGNSTQWLRGEQAWWGLPLPQASIHYSAAVSQPSWEACIGVHIKGQDVCLLCNNYAVVSRKKKDEKWTALCISSPHFSEVWKAA